MFINTLSKTKKVSTCKFFIVRLDHYKKLKLIFDFFFWNNLKVIHIKNKTLIKFSIPRN